MYKVRLYIVPENGVNGSSLSNESFGKAIAHKLSQSCWCDDREQNPRPFHGTAKSAAAAAENAGVRQEGNGKTTNEVSTRPMPQSCKSKLINAISAVWEFNKRC